MNIEFIPCNLKYLAVACKRSNSDVGALIKGLYAYFTESKKQTYENEGMQMLYDLFVDDLEGFLASKRKQSKTNSDNASNKKGSGKSKNAKQKKGNTVTTIANDSADEDADDGSDTGEDSSSDGDAVVADNSETSVSDDSVKPTEVVSETSDTANAQLSFDFANELSETSDRNDSEKNVTDVVDSSKDNAVPTFEKVRDVYNKTGGNENQALAKWQQLSDDEKTSAFAYAESIAGKRDNRSYLYVFLRDKQWTKSLRNKFSSAKASRRLFVSTHTTVCLHSNKHLAASIQR